jgi:hypothetical protein
MGRRQSAKTPRGFVRLHRLNKEPGNLGFTIPVSLNRAMENAGYQAGDLFRPVLILGGIAFIKVPDHSAPKEETDELDAPPPA